MAMNDKIFAAKVMHHRLTPKNNLFVYHQYYLMLKASETWSSSSNILTINRFNLFSIFFKNYGKLNGENPYYYIKELLEQNCADTSWLKEIYLLTQPSILGWVFNPVSFWFYLDNNSKVRAVLAEVNNTFGEQHKYFAYQDNFAEITSRSKLTAKKAFYVSPFYEIEGLYKFRFNFSRNSVGVWIDYYCDEEKTLATSLTGKLQPLTTHNLLIMFFKYPLANIKTLALIHWQALKIWLKGIKHVKHEKNKHKAVSRCR